MIRNVIFDVGDVLVKTNVREAISAHGYDVAMTDHIMQATYDSPLWKELDRGIWFYSDVIAQFCASAPDLTEQIKAVFRNTSGFIIKHSDTDEWIQMQQKKALRVFCLSNMPHKVCCDCGKELNFLQYTDGFLFSCNVGLLKPDPAFYRLMLRDYRLQPEECIFVDDHAENVEAAEKLGINGIVFSNREQAEHEIEQIRGRA